METIVLSTQLPVLEEVETTANTQWVASVADPSVEYPATFQALHTQALLMEIFTYQMEEQALFCSNNFLNN
jgi:hypothetical protein